MYTWQCAKTITMPSVIFMVMIGRFWFKLNSLCEVEQGCESEWYAYKNRVRFTMVLHHIVSLETLLFVRCAMTFFWAYFSNSPTVVDIGCLGDVSVWYKHWWSGTVDTSCLWVIKFPRNKRCAQSQTFMHCKISLFSTVHITQLCMHTTTLFSPCPVG